MSFGSDSLRKFIEDTHNPIAYTWHCGMINLLRESMSKILAYQRYRLHIDKGLNQNRQKSKSRHTKLSQRQGPAKPIVQSIQFLLDHLNTKSVRKLKNVHASVTRRCLPKPGSAGLGPARVPGGWADNTHSYQFDCSAVSYYYHCHPINDRIC